MDEKTTTTTDHPAPSGEVDFRRRTDLDVGDIVRGITDEEKGELGQVTEEEPRGRGARAPVEKPAKPVRGRAAAEDDDEGEDPPLFDGVAGDEEKGAPKTSAVEQRLDRLLEALGRRAEEEPRTRREREAPAPAEDELSDDQLADESPAVQKLARTVKELAAKNEALLERLGASEQKEIEEELVQEIVDTMPLYRLNEKEQLLVVDATLAYLKKNPDLADALSFEEAANRAVPGLRARAHRSQAPSDNAPSRQGRRAPAKIVDTSSPGSGSGRDKPPGPGRDFKDIARQLVTTHGHLLGKYNRG